MEYLYHYTSLQTLALILSNKSICFNNLLYVDDMEEAESQDMGKFGRFIYVSCWTSIETESIPLWNLYTPDMHGVRIKLPKFPFKKKFYKKGDFWLVEDIETYIDMEKIFEDNKVSIVGNQPQLAEVEYTNDENKLFPKVRTISSQEAFERYLNSKDIDEISDFKVSYSFNELGRYKRDEWSFQKEWRYIISVSPMGLKESNPPTLQKQQEIIRRIENKEYVPAYDHIFLQLDENALQEIEVLCGPKMSQAEKILLKSLLKEYAPNGVIKESRLKIK